MALPINNRHARSSGISRETAVQRNFDAIVGNDEEGNYVAREIAPLQVYPCGCTDEVSTMPECVFTGDAAAGG
jgi:hypothetical protein